MHHRKLLLVLDDLSEVHSFWIVTCGTTAMPNRETKRLFQIAPTMCRSMWRRLRFPTASTNSCHRLFWIWNLGKPRISTERVVMTNPSTLSKNDDVLTTKLYPILSHPSLFLFFMYFFDVFLVYFDGSNSGWISHLIPSHLGHVKQLWIPLSDSVFLEANGSASATGGIGRFTVWKKHHWKAQHDTISCYTLAVDCYSRCSNWIMEVRIGTAGRKHNGLPESLENHLNSKPVGTTVLSEKNGAARDLVKSHEISHSYHAFLVPRRGTGISLDTTWARNGCSTRLSDTPSSKRLFDLKSDEIHRLELWTRGKPTSYVTRMVWITRVRFWSGKFSMISR